MKTAKTVGFVVLCMGLPTKQRKVRYSTMSSLSLEIGEPVLLYGTKAVAKKAVLVNQSIAPQMSWTVVRVIAAEGSGND